VHVLIRAATEEDAEDLSRLLTEVNDLHADALPRIYRRVEANGPTADFLRGQIAAEGNHFFVAERAGEVVGYVSLRLNQAASVPVLVPRRSVAIDTVVVSRAYRHLGIGEALVRRAHEWADEQGIDQAELVVAKFNATAIKLYEKLGYATLWRRMWRSLADPSPTDEGTD
jgi:ribosomal protein S18 acetylase RimI-like enzyme